MGRTNLPHPAYPFGDPPIPSFSSPSIRTGALATASLPYSETLSLRESGFDPDALRREAWRDVG